MDLDDQFEDFTNASDWECFTAALEQYLSEWQGRPVETENVHSNWVIYNEKVTFADWPFQFTYFKLVSTDSKIVSNSDMTTSFISSSSALPTDSSLPQYLVGGSLSSNEEDFPPPYVPHPIAGLFCLKEFAVLTSASMEPMHNESKLKVLLSSACIALNNTNSSYPIFVQFHPVPQKYFVGVAESCGIRTYFQMVHLRKVSDQLNYFSGLLDIFKSKIGSNLTTSVQISAHFFYKMKAWHLDFTFESFPPEVLEMLQTSDEESDAQGNGNKDVTSSNESITFTHFLPFGSIDDPFQALDFVAGWPSLTEDVVVDNAGYSDLEPDNAPLWYFGLIVDPSAEFRLHDMLDGFWKLRTEMRSIEDILGKNLQEDDSDAQYMSALDKITQSSIPVPGFNNVINKAQKRLLFSPTVYTDLPPLPSEQLDTIMQFLFPDAYPSISVKYPYPASFDRVAEYESETLSSIMENLQGIKSAPVGSLVWRLSIITAHLHAYVGANSAVAHLWAEMVLEFRYRWENSKLISGLEKGAPNSGTCLLNQKLQMLNCCIERKLLREKKEKSSSDGEGIDSPVEESEEEDDEFFDCDDTLAMPSENVAKLNKPVGRLRKCGRLRLLKTGEPMYIPITQDPPPLTEDVLEEQAKILVELGTDAEGTAMRAKMLSVSLLSDMESFKAANPGAGLDDFVRWYSPRDWIETEELDEFENKTGDLSPRMKVPGNLWLEVWANAQPVPARRQKRLFDDTKEAEKVLHWMSSCKLSDVSQLLFPCLIHAVAAKVLEEVSKLPIQYKTPLNLAQVVTQLSRSVGFISGNNSDSNDVNNYRTSLMSSILKCEKDINQIRSFQQKFPQIDVNELLQRQAEGESTSSSELLPNYIKVENGAKSEVGEVIKEIFRKEVALNQLVDPNTQFRFAEPIKRVFVLKYNPRKSESCNDSSLPQRMYCCLKPDDFLLAGTFSTKTDLSYSA